MMYEYHIASVTHMKFKAEKAAAEEAEQGEEADLDGFMTVDSVGDGGWGVGNRTLLLFNIR